MTRATGCMSTKLCRWKAFAKKRRRRAKTPARPRSTTTRIRRRRGGADEDHVVEGGNFFNDMLDGVSKVASTVASVALFVMPLLSVQTMTS